LLLSWLNADKNVQLFRLSATELNTTSFLNRRRGLLLTCKVMLKMQR